MAPQATSKRGAKVVPAVGSLLPLWIVASGLWAAATLPRKKYDVVTYGKRDNRHYSSVCSLSGVFGDDFPE